MKRVIHTCGFLARLCQMQSLFNRRNNGIYTIYQVELERVKPYRKRNNIKQAFKQFWRYASIQ